MTQNGGSALLVIAALLVSLVGGGGAGALTSYWLRRRGDLLCQVLAWSGGDYGSVRDIRTFTVRLLNEKDIGTALWNLRVVFYKSGEPRLTKPTTDSSQVPHDVLDLPPQETITRVFWVGFYTEGEPLEEARDSDSIKLIADIPGEGEGVFELDLAPWGRNAPPELPPWRQARVRLPWWRRLLRQVW